jgi:adenine-specific DNA methylase
VSRFAVEGDDVCDLFCGSGVVSQYLSSHYRITACDIQNYSATITKAILHRSEMRSDDVDKFANRIASGEALKRLQAEYAPLINHEISCIQQAQEGKPESLLIFSEYASEYMYHNSPATLDIPAAIQQSLASVAENRRLNQRARPPLVSFYYGGAYFSFAQTVVLDAILETINAIKSPTNQKTILLAALLSTASSIVNTVGKQFAQPMKLRTRAGTPKALLVERTIRDRSYDVLDMYTRILHEYLAAGPLANREHSVECCDFREILARRKKPFACIYADPPYTIDHYSRFYHVLETICLQDYPELDSMRRNGQTRIMRGLYRSGRHQSPFCIPSEVEGAFRSLLENAARLTSPLVLSYSPFNPGNNDRPRLLTLEGITELGRQFYPRVTVVDAAPHSHRKLHSTNKNQDAISNAETFVVCSMD